MRLEATPIEPPNILGESHAILDLLEVASLVAPLDRPVLVIGERGTGKELVAARLHYLSGRWAQPFVKVNCAALNEQLLESELFGHEAGAFTGATRRRIGRFELADRGTLLLDEIANASLRVQEQVLRVVEYGEFERVGASETRRVQVRVIGATNVDLPARARAGRFRHDLLDRLAFDVLTVPPLRARDGDISLLARHFARGIALELDRPDAAVLSAPVLAALERYEWPGNVRELRNVVERAVHRAENTVAAGGLVFDPFDSPYRPAVAAPPADAAVAPQSVTSAPAPTPAAGAGQGYRAALDAHARALLEEALSACRFNRKQAAQHLGLSYHQLRNELRKHGLATTRNDDEGVS